MLSSIGTSRHWVTIAFSANIFMGLLLRVTNKKCMCVCACVRTFVYVCYTYLASEYAKFTL